MNVAHYEAHWPDGMPLWISLLLAQVKVGGIRGIARELRVDPSLIVHCLRRKRPGITLSQRVLTRWGELECQAFGDRITAVQCTERRDVPCPTHNPMAMQRWKACLQCPNNSQSKDHQHG